MKKLYRSRFIFPTLIALMMLGAYCTKKDINIKDPEQITTTTTETKTSAGKVKSYKRNKSSSKEKPLPVVGNTNSARTQGSITCGVSYSDTYYGYNHYYYASVNLDLATYSGPVTLHVIAYQNPNRFILRNGNGTIVAQTGWLGYANFSGPWGSSLNTNDEADLFFNSTANFGYHLDVETYNSNSSDEWEAVLNCSSGDVTASYAGVDITYEAASGLLNFNSITDVNIVLDQLELDEETYNNNYESQYPNYTADQLDNMDDINNFDEFQSYRDFENLFPGYASKRQQVENTEVAWLNNNYTGLSPQEVDITLDEAENTIFNSSYSFKVAGDTYELKSDGLYINGVFQPATAMEPPTTGKPLCYAGRTQRFDEPAGLGKRYKLEVAVHSIGFRSSAKGKVVSFKLKNGKWKRSRSEMAVSAGGNIYTPKCDFNFQFNNRKPSPSGFKKRKQLKVAYRHYGAGGQIVYKTKTQQMGSSFEVNNVYASPVLYLD
jgi:hypothetical protein